METLPASVLVETGVVKMGINVEAFVSVEDEDVPIVRLCVV